PVPRCSRVPYTTLFRSLMRLPYLEYIYEKSLVDEGFKNRWNMLICILSIVLQEQSFDIIREDGRLYLKVYQRSKDYELLNKKYIDRKSTRLNSSHVSSS